ncbi:MAG: hypothetical protein K2X66_03195 [Cyanobacteria bacterium]|nr:hypothetical protein [Cyanobacteriota bacterium]
MRFQSRYPTVSFQATYRFDNAIKKEDPLTEHPLYQVVSLTDPEYPLKFNSPHTEFNKPLVPSEMKKESLVLPGGKPKDSEQEEHSYFGLIDESSYPWKSLVLITSFSPLETIKNFKKCLEMVGQMQKVGLIREETFQRLKAFMNQLFLGIGDGGFVKGDGSTTYLTHGPIRTARDPETIFQKHQKKQN